ncbi:MAG: outer membrane protein assembly factor BamD, partial [Verrucomicrobiota bacterium]
IAVDRKETYRVKIFGVLPGFLNHDRAIKYFERVMSIAPYSDYAPLSLMNVAQIWAIKKNDTLAIYALDRLIINYPKHFLTPDAYLKLGETHETLIRGPFYDQRSTEEAMRYFEDFMIRFPQNRSVDDAEDGLENTQNEMALSKLKIGDFYFYKRNRFHAAEVLYNEAITIAPTSDTAELARNRLTAVAAKRARFEEENRDKKVPSLEEMQKKAEKRAKRRILGIF